MTLKIVLSTVITHCSVTILLYVYIIEKNVKFLKAKLQYDLDNSSDWLLANELSLGTEKNKMYATTEYVPRIRTR